MEREALLARLLVKPTGVTDETTGLYQESYFHSIFRRDMLTGLRNGEHLTIGVLGAGAGPAGETAQAGPRGDSAFLAVGRLIKSQIREVDLAAYIGDGLFLMEFSRTNAESARNAGERIRAAVLKEIKGETGVTIGLASFPEDGLNDEAVVGKAADAYLHAIELGGNRVFFFEHPKRMATGSDARVLLVDDDPRNLKLLKAQMAPLGFELLTATSGEEALGIVQGAGVDLVLLDVMMPGIGGFETCRRIKANESTRQVPVILLTALNDSPSRLKGIESGADDFISKPANTEELSARTRSLVRLRRLNRDRVSLENALFSLANAVEAKDNYTLGHTQRVSTLAVALGAHLGMGEAELQALRLGGILHDVGKIGVPEEILNKPGPLSEKEWTLMKSHAELGYTICLPLIESIGPALDVIRHHHEKLDGSSYPDGLRGDDVTRMARIMAVVDCYDAMVTDRPYRAGMEKAKALAILRDDVTRGRLDGQIVDALESLVTNQRGP